MTKRHSLVPVERIESRILSIRGQRVMLDADLAELYGVTTKVLNQAVKRNAARFPEDFMFRLDKTEKKEVVTNCDRLARLKFSRSMPCAFTEQGVAMLSSVLRSERAIQVNVEVMRTFVRLRRLLTTHEELAKRLDELEREYDAKFVLVFKAIRALMEAPEEPSGEPRKGRIGFQPLSSEGEPGA